MKLKLLISVFLLVVVVALFKLQHDKIETLESEIEALRELTDTHYQEIDDAHQRMSELEQEIQNYIEEN